MSAIPFDRKIVSISPKRQITIPQKYFKMLGFENEAECILRGNELVIKPVQILSDSEFSEQILEELIDSGLSGHELLEAFKAKQADVKYAVKNMIAEAKKVAEGKAEYATMDDVFKE